MNKFGIHFAVFVIILQGLFWKLVVMRTL